jgi:hypothetical protein
MAFVISSCAPLLKNYGTIKMISETQNKMTIDTLIKNWNEYDVYYTDSYDGYNPRAALGVMFDPKNDETKLVGDHWKKVRSQSDLIEITQWIYSNTHFEPWLNEILGPNGRLYGYIYYSYGGVTLKKINDNTIYVFNLEEPSFKEGGGLETTM